MSSHTQEDLNAVIDGIPGRQLPQIFHVITGFAMAVGVFGFLYGRLFSEVGTAWTWGSFLVGVVYLLAIAQGGVIFSVILSGTWANWGRPIKRIAEVLGLFMIPAYVLLLIFLVGGTGIYVWHPSTIIDLDSAMLGSDGTYSLATHSPEAIATKAVWLNPIFFVVRQALAVGALLVLDLFYIRASLRPDMMMAKARLGSKAPAWWDTVIGGKTDLEAEIKSSQWWQEALVPVIAMSFALIFSLVAFDLIMSLSPWWYSNMFGGWVFASSVWLSLCTVGLISMVTLDWLGLRKFIKPKVTHDLGKLMLAFTMFWAYTGFAQLLPIYYADMPEETDFLLIRLFLPQWAWLAKVVAVMCFIAPFTVLLSRGIKKMRWPFAGICFFIMVGLFMERSLLIFPSIYFGEHFPFMEFLFVNITMYIGFMGLLAAFVGRVLTQIPPLVLTDPQLGDHPWDVHVHSLDAHHSGGHGQGH